MTVRRPLLPVLALLTVLVTAVAAGSLPAEAAPAVSVLSGTTPQTSVFPSNRFTVPDASQLTGRRIDLPMPECGEDTYSACDDVTLLNQLDGFDIQPRVTVPFSGPIQLDSVNSSTVYVEGPGYRAGLTQIVWDPATNILAGTPKDQLTEQTTYTIVIAGVLDADGHPVTVPAVSRRTTFTTMSATTELDRLRQSLDSGLAYTQAGITDGAKTAKVDATFTAATGTGIQRMNQVEADPAKPLRSEVVQTTQIPALTTIGFGSFVSPQFVDGEGVIEQVPTTQTPPARDKARIGFTLIVPNTPKPAGGFPVAVYGPGFTRSKYDLFLTADFNAAFGVATLATDPLGHAYGPKSTVEITQGVSKTTVSAYGRGKDLDLDGRISASEGAGPTYTTTKQPDGSYKPTTPSRKAIVGLRDGLIQTVVDNMALVRTIEAGIDIDGDGTSDLSADPVKAPVMYYGLSFGGIYGTMLMGTDTHVATGLLNVGGGPIVDIARLSGFRDLLAKQLSANKPSLLNGGPGLEGFTESIPLPLDPRVTKPVPGAIALQEYFSRGNWLERPGSPESYAPLIRLRLFYFSKK